MAWWQRGKPRTSSKSVADKGLAAVASAEERIAAAARDHADVLDLSDLQLETLPESLCMLTELKSLDASGNRLTTLPAGIGNLTALQSLVLFKNRLIVLPEGIGNLTALKSVDCFRNQLIVLPEGIGKLTALESLYVSRNKLTALPDWIGNLTRLRILDVSHNNLLTLPETINNLKELRELFLHDNLELAIPFEVLGPSFEDTHQSQRTKATPSRNILDYYFRSRQGRSLNEAKLILIGRGGAGKTSLVKRLVENQFEPGEKKTEGIQITQWSIRLLDKEDVSLNVWDFGGQEIMHSTHQFFLTQRSVYLLVISGREGTEDLDADYCEVSYGVRLSYCIISPVVSPVIVPCSGRDRPRMRRKAG